MPKTLKNYVRNILWRRVCYSLWRARRRLVLGWRTLSRRKWARHNQPNRRVNFDEHSHEAGLPEGLPRAMSQLRSIFSRRKLWLYQSRDWHSIGTFKQVIANKVGSDHAREEERPWQFQREDIQKQGLILAEQIGDVLKLLMQIFVQTVASLKCPIEYASAVAHIKDVKLWR